MKECPFCDISKENRIIDETERTFSILSNPCLMKGHCLIVPKRHVERLDELSNEELSEIFNETIKIQKLLLKKFKGCDIRQNCRPFQKQDNLKVNHLHIHLQPRELFDELYEKSQKFEKDIFRKLNHKELDEIKEFILK